MILVVADHIFQRRVHTNAVEKVESQTHPCDLEPPPTHEHPLFAGKYKSQITFSAQLKQDCG